ncbi:aldehyde dehydrogenase family 3 member B1 [Pseudohyphozyma bogoriensis]|nr:aldehyde dehydrogenase family 3 member B1 [Pseudohyphozyma bogoriensis]
MTKLVYTDIAAIAPIHDKVTATFDSGKTRSIAWRKNQILQLGLLIEDNEDLLIAALQDDLGKPKVEAITGELGPLKHEVNDFLAHLNKWSKPEKAKTTAVWATAKAKIYKEPKGTVLIIAPWNSLLLQPFIGAIAAGNTAVLKPAEQCPAVCNALTKLLPEYLDSSAFQIVNGAVDETTELLKLKWDHVFYTGSGAVGRIVAKAAAEHLTPTTLELGGKSPVIPDYILCTPATQQKLVVALQNAIKEFTTSVPNPSSPAKTRVINQRQFDRLSNLLAETKGNIVIGGGKEEKGLGMEVTVVTDVKEDDVLMQNEIFGPIIPVLTLSSKEEMTKFIRSRDSPLALYVFTQSTAECKSIFETTRSGGFVHNDVLVHGAIPGLPFGGTGASGYGNYKSKRSFDTFSHERSSASIPTWMDALLASRYPPYTPGKLKMLLFASGVSINRPSLWKRFFRVALVAAIVLYAGKTAGNKLRLAS